MTKLRAVQFKQQVETSEGVQETVTHISHIRVVNKAPFVKGGGLQRITVGKTVSRVTVEYERHPPPFIDRSPCSVSFASPAGTPGKTTITQNDVVQ